MFERLAAVSHLNCSLFSLYKFRNKNSFRCDLFILLAKSCQTY